MEKNQPPSLVFGRTQRQDEEWNCFIVNKEESLSYALIGGYCYGEVGRFYLDDGQPDL